MLIQFIRVLTLSCSRQDARQPNLQDGQKSLHRVTSLNVLLSHEVLQTHAECLCDVLARVNWKSHQCRTAICASLALMWGGWQIFPIYTSRRRGRIQKLTQRRAVTIANQLCVPNLLLTCRTAYFAKLLKIEHRSLQSVTVFDKQARQPSTIRLSFGTFGKLCTLHIHASMHLTQQCSCCPKVR